VSLSQHIIKLEEELRVQLPVRSSRGIQRTEVGSLLVSRARSICESMPRCIRDVGQSRTIIGAIVPFAMPLFVSMVMSATLAVTVRNDFPDVRLQAIDAMYGHIKAWIRDRTVDTGFLYDLRPFSGVWTSDSGRSTQMAKRLRAGQVFINDYGARGGAEPPFGGVGKSGHGREKGFEARNAFTTVKKVAADQG
jgi:DNA-binding transcriptional LysR family regulator